MKFKKRYFLLPTAVVLICLLFLYNKVLRPVRIACIGDSITYGAHVKERTKNCYPAQLQNLLGKDYLVRNFGASGYSLQKNSDRSYWNHEYFQKSSLYNPDIVLIMLGTNDTTPYNWIDTKTFFDDYRELISHYKSLKSEPEIILMTPATVFSENLNPEYNYKIRAEITEQIASTMKMFALEEGLPLIDIHEITSKHPEYFKRDGIHPDAFGDALIAEAVYNMLQ